MTLTGVILLIPQLSGASDKHKTLSAMVSYQEALHVIYETIGCNDVKRKPDLSYKLSDAAQKASPVGLGCDDDWGGLCEEVRGLCDSYPGERAGKFPSKVILLR